MWVLIREMKTSNFFAVYMYSQLSLRQTPLGPVLAVCL